ESLAFQAFVDGMTQIAVMNPGSGNWTVLTKDRTHGYVSAHTWSHDGTHIYYTRYADVPLGVYSVPALGGEERLVLENAVGGEALPDGSVLVGRINANRQMQIYRHWPADGRLTPLPGLVTDFESFPLRVFPDGKRAVFRGRSLDQPASDAIDYLMMLDVGGASVSKFRAASYGQGSDLGGNPSAFAI